MPQISRGENICYLNYIINFRINQGGVFIPEARPGYYAVIPAEVRYDDRIQANAKLLYGEISALLNAEGYCFASNGYFAELYGVTERTISGLISKLQKCGYLQIEIRRDESGQVVSRRIRLAPSITDGHPVEKIFHTPRKDFQEGIENNFQYTNPSNTDIYKENKKESSAEGEGSPPKEEQKKKRQTTKLTIVNRCEDEDSYKLLSGDDVTRYRLRRNMDAALRGDTTSRAAFYKTMREIGGYSVDDIMALEDRPNVPGGNTRQASLNYVPLEWFEILSLLRNGGKNADPSE